MVLWREVPGCKEPVKEVGRELRAESFRLSESVRGECAKVQARGRGGGIFAQYSGRHRMGGDRLGTRLFAWGTRLVKRVNNDANKVWRRADTPTSPQNLLFQPQKHQLNTTLIFCRFQPVKLLSEPHASEVDLGHARTNCRLRPNNSHREARRFQDSHQSHNQENTGRVDPLSVSIVTDSYQQLVVTRSNYSSGVVPTARVAAVQADVAAPLQLEAAVAMTAKSTIFVAHRGVRVGKPLFCEAWRLGFCVNPVYVHFFQPRKQAESRQKCRC